MLHSVDVGARQSLGSALVWGLGFILLGMLPGFLSAQGDGHVGVRQFSPEGRTDGQRLVSAVFTHDMVKLGQTDSPAPFDLRCGLRVEAKTDHSPAITGTGGWTDARTWTWNLERSLMPGERCEFVLREGLKTRTGESLGGRRRFSFYADGPWPRAITPSAGSKIDEEQRFIITTGSAIDVSSLANHLWCEAEGVGQRIPVRVSPASERSEILRAEDIADKPEKLVVYCQERLPQDKKVRLVWEPGIRAVSGAVSEKKQVFDYVVREKFRVEMSCERERASAPCLPMSAILLSFSAPVEVSQLRAIRLRTPEGIIVPKLDGESKSKNGRSQERHERELSFPGPLPQNATLTLELPSGIKDDAGRALTNADKFPLSIRTGQMPSLAKFSGSFGILEWKEGGVLPVTVRNVEANLPTRMLRLPGTHRVSEQRLTEDAEVIRTLVQMADFERQTRSVRIRQADGKGFTETTDPYYAREQSFLAGRSGVFARDLPKPGGVEAFEVLGIPLEKPGLHLVEIESKLLGSALLSSGKPMYVRTAALVTNMAVHLKLGRNNALVWVTTLDGGKPVANAQVRVSSCDGKAQWQGQTDAQGRAFIQKAIDRSPCSRSARRLRTTSASADEAQEEETQSEEDHFIFASARLGDDYSFVRSDWQQGIESWRFGLNTWSEPQALRFHSVLDRTLLRVGQTVSMKHFVRLREDSGFRLPEEAQLPRKLVIRHQESNTEITQPLVWREGSALSQWTIPPGAKLGAYEIKLVGERGQEHLGGDLRVGDFRLPVYTGSITGAPPTQVADREVKLALALNFLNGGAAKNAPVTVSATLRPHGLSFPGGGEQDRFDFNSDLSDEVLPHFDRSPRSSRERLVLDKQEVKLDQAGTARLSFKLDEPVDRPSELYAEMSFTDPNGEIQTLKGTVLLLASSVHLGIRVGDREGSRGKKVVKLLALDTQGRPLSGQAMSVQGVRRVDYSHRRRLVGGFYAFDHGHEYIKLGELCHGVTDSRGQFVCDLSTQSAAREPGNLYLMAQTRDAQGRLARIGDNIWIGGEGEQWFEPENHDRMDVLADKSSYRPGQTAHLQVRMPFREAHALIAVEADGVIETFVREISRFDPVIDLPIKGEWGPNVYVSVLAVRGRVEPLRWQSFFQWGWKDPLAWWREWWQPVRPDAQVDLAKPAYRLGVAELNVGNDNFRLHVDVLPGKMEARPRETLTARLRARLPDGSPAAGYEIAFAAVDQALLELRPNETWNALEAMLPHRAYQVETATAQSQVVGKRHYGKKAVPIGGGGGRAPARELFDTLLAWQPRVILDAQGEAQVSFQMNDALSEFVLTALADGGSKAPGLFGLGEARVRSRQDLQIISGTPPLVREGDRYQAMVTIRNGSTRPMKVRLEARAGEQSLAAKEMELDPESAKEVSWPTQAPEGVGTLTWAFSAKQTGGPAADQLRVNQEVAPAVPLTVRQATFVDIPASGFSLPAALPTGALPGKGGVEVTLADRLTTPPPGLLRYFQEYPYSCLEQKTSIAVGLHDEKRWREMIGTLPALQDERGLVRYFPGEGPGSETLTAYVLNMAALSGFGLPDEARSRMKSGLRDYVLGRIKSTSRSSRDDQMQRRLQALEALTRQGAVDEDLLRAATLIEGDVLRQPTSALIDWLLVARRLEKLPRRTQQIDALERELRNRLSYAGGRLTFNTDRDDQGWWLMVSSDSNSFRLIEAMLDQKAWQADLPKLLRGAIERQSRGHWNLTTANAWARVTLDLFAQRFERDKVEGITRATLGAAQAEWAWRGELPTASKRLPWASGEQSLQIRHQGKGTPWANVAVLAAVPSRSAQSQGYRVMREVTPLTEKIKGKVSRGDIWRVKLRIDSAQEMAWVVVNDPIPAGARILGDGDGRDSRLSVRGEKSASGRAYPAFIERSFAGLRAYYEHVPKGQFELEYTLILNNAGHFSLPPTRVEALYAPELFGELPLMPVEVGE
jgi:uncharacterized protein YfaS (alpha-2-macroglobulin family)